MNQSLQNMLQTAVQHLRNNQLEAAEQLARQMIAAFPAEAEVGLFGAEVARQGNDLALGLSRLDTALGANPEDARLLLRRAQFLFDLRRRAEARRGVVAAVRYVSDDLWQLRTVAQLLRDGQDLPAAREWLLEAVTRLPGRPELLHDLAVIDFHLNLPDEAEGHIAQLLEIQPFHPGALHLRSALRKQTAETNHVDDLRDRLERGPDHPNLVTAIHYAMAKELEDLGDFTASFAALETGANAYRSTFSFNVNDELAAHEHIRSTFTAEALNRLPQGHQAAGPIFVVGMPRTGTTLVERVLSGHSQVSSIGEFTDFPNLLAEAIDAAGREQASGDAALSIDFSRLGADYLDAARQLAGDTPFFVDKLPFNFQYCGYILAALPQARIVHLTRDLMDTCYAVYKTLFFGAYRFSYQLEELADYLVSYRRLMDHWQALFPDQILNVAYEDLVSDPEAESRRLLEGCGLPWEPEVLDFHRLDTASMTASAMQVREPMHTGSIGAWQRVAAGLAPARQRLAAAGLVD